MDYNSTLQLPETEFPMRAGLPKREPEMLKSWQEQNLYEQIQEKGKDKPLFILHDGPPFSNGDIHAGHALNKILKDFVIRYKTMAGFRAPYVPGWDNHGMPIESAIIKKNKLDRAKMSVPEFRSACHDFAQNFVDRHTEQFQRLGVLGDWKHPYLTMDPSFEAEEIKIFGEMYEKGFIYKGLKPVYWCAHDGTALAEAEIEYADDQCRTVYVSFAVNDDKGLLSAYGDLKDTSFVIWTTTIWTLPGNLAICLHPQLEYVLVQSGGKRFIVADSLKDSVAKAAGWTEYSVLTSFKGRELEGLTARHPFLDRDSLIIVGDHVTADTGTGCVHTAPGHGAEDYFISQKYKLTILVPVDDKGVMTADAGQFAGMYYSKANTAIFDYLQETGALLASETITHSYPHCWRCNEPILFRATEQWFASVDAIKEKAVSEALGVKWYPEWGEARIVSMISERADWCISRQRNWGLPIPAFYCDSCKKAVVTKESVKTVSELFAKEGSNAWYSKEASDILPEGFKCPHCGFDHFTKEKDTLDGWFDSGSSHAAVLRTRPELAWPSDLYLEGNDQYRGWFQSSLLISVATMDCVAPYKEVVTGGMVVDVNSKKMSKSIGNGVDPLKICDDFGADILRLWVSSADYHNDMKLSYDMFKSLSEIYLKIRNTCRFLLGNLKGFDPDKQETELLEIDRWALYRLDLLIDRIRESYDTYEYHTIFHAIHNFCVIDMSNFYLDILKDRLYCDELNGVSRRSAQTVIYRILDALVRLVAPVLAFTSEELWGFMPHHSGVDKLSVLCNDMPKSSGVAFDEQAKWEKLVALRLEINQELEKARAAKKIGKSLEAAVTISAQGEELDFLRSCESSIPAIALVSKVTLVEGSHSITVSVAPGGKCLRCWGFFEDLGTQEEHPELCPRCTNVVTA